MAYGRNDFRNWILQNHNIKYEISEIEDGLILQTSYAKGEINFVESMGYEIVEMKIHDLINRQDVFYIHFELSDPETAREFFREMEDDLLNLKEGCGDKVLLCCTGGLTSLYFATKLNEIANQLRKNICFDAVPYNRLLDSADDYDIVLIAPQIRNNLDSIRKAIPEKYVTDIPVKVFSHYDTFGLLKLVDIIKAYRQVNVSN